VVGREIDRLPFIITPPSTNVKRNLAFPGPRVPHLILASRLWFD
jgi:hypothetical protein